MDLPEVCNQANLPQPEVFRPLANFPPSLWGDRFISFSVDHQVYESYGNEIDVLKGEVRDMLVAGGSKATAEKMKLINTLERLGVSYHFENEIKEQLELILHAHPNFEKASEDFDLCTTALHFRIFRQHGYNISCDVFNKFQDKDGKFKENLTSDIMGMLSLYEAAHLRIRGEHVLDEALDFTTSHLNEYNGKTLSSSMATQVKHALKQPLHKGIPRIEARHYISIYQEEASMNQMLLSLAKLDFNTLQLLHKQELSLVSRWWKDLDLASKLSYARDRVVECYFWTVAVYFEPRYSIGRIMLAKIIVMVSVIDDTFDAFGTIDELKLFLDAVDRWDTSAIDLLPDYMKISYTVLLDLYQEFNDEMTKQGRSYAFYHARNAMKELVRCYYVEAKWFNKGYVPSFDEYMVNALITSATNKLTVSAFMGMGELATAEAFDWLVNKPKVVKASQTIGRLIDDIMTYEDEIKRGHVATSIECYMKQYGGSTEEIIAEFYKRIDDAWKDINEEGLRPTSIPMHLLVRVLNLTRILDVTYKFDDGYTYPEKEFKDHIYSLFVDAIPI